MKTLRVLVADDHRLMLAAVRRALSTTDDFEIVAEISAGTRVIPAVRETNPDVVVLDLRMPELDGLTCLARLRKHDPALPVVILSSYCDDEEIAAARDAGAVGYIVKTVEPVDLPAVLRNALAGESSFAVWGAAEERPPEETNETARLSEREAAVLEALARGLSNREIGRELWISEQTVKFHLRNLYRKLGVSTRTEAARHAYRTGVRPTLSARAP